jgi:uncharacterized lipoprotein YmbA
MRLGPLHCAMLLMLLMCGCRSAPITYYTLTPAIHVDATAESGRPAIKAILVLRSLPVGIDTTQILIRTDDTRFRVEEGGRWVAPLGDELRGALVDSLRRQYGIIVTDGVRHGDAPVPRIDLTVRKFDIVEGSPVSGSSITLAADWALSNSGHEPNSSLSCQAEITKTSAGTVAGAVAAGQAAVVNLSQVLGAAIEAGSKGESPGC